MQASTPAFAASVVSASQTTAFTVTIDLPSAGAYNDVTLAVESIEVDRQTVTDLPDGTRLITGYPSASATVVLSGYVDPSDASKTAAWLMNPYEPTSPMYRHDLAGQSATIEAGLYLPGQALPEDITVFTGVVDDYTVDPQAGTVSLTCLDYRNKVYGSPVVPSVFDDGTQAAATLYSQFALDWLLRARGFYSWPAQRASCCLAAGFRGGLYPERGTFKSVTLGTAFPSPLFTAAPDGDGMGLTGAAAAIDLNPAISGATTPIFCEFYTDSLTPAVTLTDVPSPNVTIIFQASSTTMGVQLKPDNTGTHDTAFNLNIAGATGYHGFQLSWSGTAVTLTVRRGGITATGSTTTPVARPSATLAHASVQSNTLSLAANQINSVQVTTEAAGAFNDTFVANAVLGESLNPITVIPDISNTDVWSVIQQIAEAEQAIAGFDETGVFRFINRKVIKAQASQRTITPTYSLKTLQQQVSTSMLRNHIQVPVFPVQVQPFSTIWSASDAPIIAAGGTFETVITTSSPIVGLATTCGLIPSGGLVATNSGYRASRNPNATVPITNLIMTVTQTGPTTVDVKVVNPNGFTVYLITPSGAGYPAGSVGMPALGVGAQYALPATALIPDSTTSTTSSAVTADAQWPPVVEGGAITNVRGELLLALPANAWVQALAPAQDMAEGLLEDLYALRPLWRNVAIVTDPRLQLADRVTVNDPVTSKVNDDALIIGSKIVVSKTDWTQTLDLRCLSTPGGWLMGVAGRSEISATTYI